MAWGGKNAGRMTEKQRRHFLRHSNRRLSLRENPLGVLFAVCSALTLAVFPCALAAAGAAIYPFPVPAISWTFLT